MHRFLALLLLVPAVVLPTPSSAVPAPTNGVLDPLDVWYPTGMTPYSLVVADLSGDGKTDFATGNVNAGTISIYLGNGTGGFTQAPGSPLTGVHVAEMRAGFVNGDTVADLVGIRKEPVLSGLDVVLTWLGTGGGSFAQPVAGSNLGPNGGDGIALADYTGDDVLDVALTNSYTLDTTNVRVFHVRAGDGAGHWVTDQEYVERADTSNSNPLSAIENGDMDEDGDIDLVVADNGGKAVSVWLNDGTGAFTRAAGSPIPIGSDPFDLRVRDVDADGHLDAVLGTLNGVTVRLGDGAGALTSAPWSPVALPEPAYEIEVGDLNADGRADVVTSSYDGKVRVLLGQADGSLAPGWGSPYTVKAVSDLGLGDVTGDGYLDVLVTNNGGGGSNLHPDTVTVLATAPDNDGPVTTINRSAPEPASGWYGPGDIGPGDIDVNASPVDVGPAGVADYKCAFGADPSSPPTSYLSMPSFCYQRITTHGVHHVYAAAVDRAGNLGPVAHDVVRIDRQAPSVAVTVVQPSPSGTYTEQPVVDVVAEDPDSGVAEVRCALAPAATYGDLPASCIIPGDLGVGEHTVFAAAVDEAGNASAVTDLTFEIVTPNASVGLSGSRASGTRLAFTATIDAVGERSVGLTFSGPASLRFDSVSGAAGCTVGPRTVSCPVAALSDGAHAVVTVLGTPAGPGPHQVAVAAATGDTDTSDDSDQFSAGPALVCDNVPTGGADTVAGTSGADILCGLGGNDIFRGLAGNDLLFGGSGHDLISYAGAPATVVDLRRQGLGVVGAWPKTGTGHGRDTITGIERARGGAGADTLIGNAAANLLLGGGSADTLSGLGGADSLYGEAGRDVLSGGTGRDLCRQLTDVRRSCER